MYLKPRGAENLWASIYGIYTNVLKTSATGRIAIPDRPSYVSTRIWTYTSGPGLGLHQSIHTDISLLVIWI